MFHFLSKSRIQKTQTKCYKCHTTLGPLSQGNLLCHWAILAYIYCCCCCPSGKIKEIYSVSATREVVYADSRYLILVTFLVVIRQQQRFEATNSKSQGLKQPAPISRLKLYIRFRCHEGIYAFKQYEQYIASYSAPHK